MSDKKVLVVGCGAIGRNIIMQCAHIGIEDVTVFDFDSVENHNVSSQGFSVYDIGLPKVQAISSELSRKVPGCIVRAYNSRWVPHNSNYDYVFLAADCMSARKSVSRFYHKRRKKSVVIDCRMRGEEARVLMSYDRLTRNYYSTTLFSNDDAADGSCTSNTNIYCSFHTSSRAIQCMVAHNRKGYLRHDVLMNMGNGLTFDLGADNEQ